MLEVDLQQEFVRLENAVWIYMFFHTVYFVPAPCFSGSDLCLKLPARSLCHPEGMLSRSDSRGSCCCLSYLMRRVIGLVTG